MNDTQITVVGNLVTDPKINATKDGIVVTTFRLASTPRRYDRAAEQWRDGDTLYVNVTCWRTLAENASASLRKGQQVLLIGRLSVRPYETKDGEKRQSVDVDAIAIGHDLARGITQLRRMERVVSSESAASEDTAEGADGEGPEGEDSEAPTGESFLGLGDVSAFDEADDRELVGADAG